MPKISVIIPIYKVEEYLPTCLDSVLAQTFQDWEAICVNDGSPDKCDKILAEYTQKDPRIKIISQPNQGASVARNNGVKHALGKYILFLDSDDFIYPQLLEICHRIAEKENADMVSFRFTKYSSENLKNTPTYNLDKLKYRLTNNPLYFQRRNIKYKVSVNPWSKLYKKELIQDISFISEIKELEDYPHSYAVFAKHPKTAILKIPLHHYTTNSNSVSLERWSQPSVKNIQNYQIGLNYVIDIYENAPKKEKRFVMHHLIPTILKPQLARIMLSPPENQPELYRAFAEELKGLNERGWLKPWGHKISRYLRYRKLIKE